MKTPLLKSRLWIILTGVLLFSTFNISAQCVVGGTNFDIGDWYLCDPELTSDTDPSTGWLSGGTSTSAAVLNAYCGAVGAADAAARHLSIEYAQHLPEGFLNNAMSTNGAGYPADGRFSGQWGGPPWSPNPIPGIASIVANPRMVFPYSIDRSDNILVSVGSDQNVPFFTYSVSGLEPFSEAVFTCEIFSLLQNWPGNANTLGGFVNYNGTSGGGITGTVLSGRVGHGVNPGDGKINSPTTALNQQNIPFSTSRMFEHKGTADKDGNITFYVAKGSGGETWRIPIGLDNVKITGTPKPKPVYLGEPCVKMPLVVNLESSYPSGTTYSWEEITTGKTGSNVGFVFEPEEVKEYNMKVSIKMPGAGCSLVSSDLYPITSKACCEDDNGNPMAKINIFYDDFGSFPNDNTYQYRDEYGVLHTLPTMRYSCGGGDLCTAGANVPFVYPQLVLPSELTTVPPNYIPIPNGGALYNGGYALSFRQPYYPGITQDMSGTGRGGMLYFSIGAVGKSDVILYKKRVDGLCQGKKIYFSAWFAPINKGRNADGYSNKVGSLVLDVLNASTGASLYTTGEVLILGNSGWRQAKDEFVMPPGVTSVYLQVRHKGWSVCGSNDVCDYAIDDILFQVCAPPNVIMDATVTGNVSMTDLCDGNDITLTVETSAIIEDTYPDIGYLFQYTLTNPQNNPNPQWIDLAPIGNAKEYVVVDPPSNPVFAGLKNGDKVYFRAVVGDRTYLADERAEWESMDALSPCRAISISMFTVEASLNCKVCTEPKDITISSTASAPLVSNIKTVNLCPGESTTLTTGDIAPPITPAYTNYIITWYKGNKTTVTGTTANPGTIANPLTVSHADATATGVKYYVQVVDKELPLSSSCHRWDSILVIANPKPTETLTPPSAFCEGELSSEPVKTIAGSTITWYSATPPSPANQLASAPTVIDKTGSTTPYTYYYIVENNTTGCKGDPNAYSFTVHSKPQSPTTSEVNMLKGSTPNPQSIASGATATGGNTLYWYISAAGAGESTTAPLQDKSNSGTFYYWVRQKSSTTPSCESDLVMVTVKVNDAPVPTVRDTTQCQDETPAVVLTTLAQADAGHTLIWYTSLSGTGSATPPTVTTATPGEQTFYVSQRNNTTLAESEKVSIKVTIIQTPTVNTPANQTKCNGAGTDAVNFTGNITSGVTYNWTNTNTAIGLAASGNGNIASFTVANSTTAPISATIEVTPTFNSCPGAPTSFTITVNPTPTVTKPANQTKCAGAATDAVEFESNITSGVTYSWTNSNTAIGLPANGTGNIASFTATNATNAAITGTIQVTPTANSCPGTPQSFTITVNPTPTVNKPVNQTKCNGAATDAVNFTSNITSGVTYSWTNTNTAIGLPASGSGNIASFTTTNSTTAPISGTIQVTPIFGGCPGTPQSFTITVNPAPMVDKPANQAKCNGSATDAVNFTGNITSGVTYNWTNSNPAIGLAASGSGNIASFTATNSTTAAISATITVTPTSTGCPGISSTFTITVNPTPTVDKPANQTKCNGTTTDAVNFTGNITSGVTYNWTNSNTAIGLPASGSGNIAAFSATNSTTAPISATITVTPTANGCPGAPESFTITVIPTPMIVVDPVAPICEGKLAQLRIYPTPSTATIDWSTHPTATPNNTAGTDVTVQPPYTGGADHRSTYTYMVTVNDVTCSKSYPVTVTVDEPLEGRIIPTRSQTCEGGDVTIDAGSYDAEVYSWTSTAFADVKSGSRITVSPQETTIYMLEISRGACIAEDEITIEVNSKPVILWIDSIGVRDREIIHKPGTGTHPLRFGVDELPADDDPVKKYLSFGSHFFYIIDAANCRSNSVEMLVEPPKLSPPHFFTPNGDGYNDTWDIPGLKEIYPEATIAIYDRFGKKLTEYKGAAEHGWDGKYLGRDMPTTDYWYEINIKEINTQYVGHFTLLRR